MTWCAGVLLLPVLALANFTQGPLLLLDSEWESWKTVYEKEYNGQVGSCTMIERYGKPMKGYLEERDILTFKQINEKLQEEEGSRRSIWEKNMQLIDAHNQEYKQGIHSYELGMNSLGDMTTEEVIAIMTGLRVPEIMESNNTFLPDGDLEKLPRSIDYRKKGYVTPVRNQGSCGSCWAFSAVGALEGLMKKKTGKLVPLSPQNLVDCVTKSHGCKGGYMHSAYEYVRRKGINSERAYPYVAKDRRCAYKAWKKAMTCRGYKNVASGNERALQAAVARVGPVSAAVSASLHTFHFYRRGVYNDKRCSCNRLNHAILVVGYSSTKRGKYWLIKNSWGKGWGMKGYMRLARNRCNACGIATYASYPI